MAAQRDSVINTIRGKNLVGHATPADIDLLFQHIDALEMALDEVDLGFKFGTDGWREHVGIGD